MTEPILNFVACPWCTSGNAADMAHYSTCPGAAERDASVRAYMKELVDGLYGPAHHGDDGATHHGYMTCGCEPINDNPTEGVLATWMPVDGDPEKMQWVPLPFVPAVRAEWYDAVRTERDSWCREAEAQRARAEKAEQERDALAGAVVVMWRQVESGDAEAYDWSTFDVSDWTLSGYPYTEAMALAIRDAHARLVPIEDAPSEGEGE